MLSRIPRPQRRVSGETALDSSTQVYYWPERMDRMTRGATVAGITAMVGGYLLLAGPMEGEESMITTAALLLVVGGAALLVGIALAHACLAREVRFHRLFCVVRQTGREDLVLPYCSYDDQWVVDLSRPKTLRIIVTGSPRGCTIMSPPQWMRVAFLEIARIQEEEGWAEPE